MAHPGDGTPIGVGIIPGTGAGTPIGAGAATMVGDIPTTGTDTTIGEAAIGTMEAGAADATLPFLQATAGEAERSDHHRATMAPVQEVLRLTAGDPVPAEITLRG